MLQKRGERYQRDSQMLQKRVERYQKDSQTLSNVFVILLKFALCTVLETIELNSFKLEKKTSRKLCDKKCFLFIIKVCPSNPIILSWWKIS